MQANSKPTTAKKRINVALQGGGAHGAYTWGVLDTLLAEPRIEIEAISGTSAGAMNAIVVAEGLVEGGRARARQQLEDFWRTVSDDALASPLRRTAWDMLASNWNLDNNPMLAFVDAMTHALSPYVLNPLNLNPLRELLKKEIDFARVQSCKSVRLFIAATNVTTGQGRVFSNGEITLEAVLASACLPHLFQAVEIDGEPYWDGGFAGNPPLSPFLKHSTSADVLLVQINPNRRPGTPRSARDIMNRMNELTFNGALLKDLQHVEFVNRALRRGDLKGLGYREIHLHRIGGGSSDLAALSASSKLNAEWAFLTHLRDLGRADADAWLDVTYDHLGHRCTMPWHEIGA
jgi:NTE family protein